MYPSYLSSLLSRQPSFYDLQIDLQRLALLVCLCELPIYQSHPLRRLPYKESSELLNLTHFLSFRSLTPSNNSQRKNQKRLNFYSLWLCNLTTSIIGRMRYAFRNVLRFLNSFSPYRLPIARTRLKLAVRF